MKNSWQILFIFCCISNNQSIWINVFSFVITAIFVDDWSFIELIPWGQMAKWWNSVTIQAIKFVMLTLTVIYTDSTRNHRHLENIDLLVMSWFQYRNTLVIFRYSSMKIGNILNALRENSLNKCYLKVFNTDHSTFIFVKKYGNNKDFCGNFPRSSLSGKEVFHVNFCEVNLDSFIIDMGAVS